MGRSVYGGIFFEVFVGILFVDDQFCVFLMLAAG